MIFGSRIASIRATGIIDKTAIGDIRNIRGIKQHDWFLRLPLGRLFKKCKMIWIRQCLFGKCVPTRGILIKMQSCIMNQKLIFSLWRFRCGYKLPLPKYWVRTPWPQKRFGNWCTVMPFKKDVTLESTSCGKPKYPWHKKVFSIGK